MARLMVKIGRAHGKKTMAVISDMNQPLGCAIGNALEVKEAIEVLRGNGPEDISGALCSTGGHDGLSWRESGNTGRGDRHGKEKK